MRPETHARSCCQMISANDYINHGWPLGKRRVLWLWEFETTYKSWSLVWSLVLTPNTQSRLSLSFQVVEANSNRMLRLCTFCHFQLSERIGSHPILSSIPHLSSGEILPYTTWGRSMWSAFQPQTAETFLTSQFQGEFGSSIQSTAVTEFTFPKKTSRVDREWVQRW